MADMAVSVWLGAIARRTSSCAPPACAPGHVDRRNARSSVKAATTAFDWNCPQHIVRRITEVEIATATRPLHDRIALLEAELAALRSRDGV